MNKLRSLLLVGAGGGIVFSALCIHQANERFYENYLMPATRLLSPEKSHRLAVLACKYKLFSKYDKTDPDILKTKFFGVPINNPVGIAAGFDKHGEAVEGLSTIGFGFVEVGTVTPNPQQGNPKPRVFRLPEDRAIINRYGFNSDGYEVVYDRLYRIREKNHFNGIFGVNLGKNKNSSTPEQDYIEGIELFSELADYLVINVSSPNTPGLRNLQNKKELEELLENVMLARNRLPLMQRRPIFLKLAPDISSEGIIDIATVVMKDKCRVDGLIIANTTLDRNDLQNASNANEAGGLSGPPLRSKSTQLIAKLYHLTNGRIPIIGVGGISSGIDAFEKLEAGATYLQLYTSFIYHGPPRISRIKQELCQILKARGFKSVNEAVGSNYRKYLDI